MNGILTSVTGVFTALIEWFVGAFPSLEAMFYNAESSSLTFLGVLSVCGLGVSIFFLIMGVIQSFLHWRG